MCTIIFGLRPLIWKILDPGFPVHQAPPHPQIHQCATEYASGSLIIQDPGFQTYDGRLP